MKKILLFVCGILIAYPIIAQENRLTPKPVTTSQIFHDIEKLGFLGTVLYVAAHPDDENTRLISYLANERMARTAYLSLTRGDGGQNLIGPQLREQLGMIRTQELLEARNIDGGEQFFTRANDFGYSKHPDETIEIWNKTQVMEDVVRIIRQFRPDIIINRFDHRTPGTTHGHHTTSAIFSVEAFKAAGDKNAFGNQLKTLETWQPSRLFFNTSWWFYGSQEAFEQADKKNLLAINSNPFYDYKGLSNHEIAALSRSEHKSQGFGSSGDRSPQKEYIEFIDGDFPTDKSDLFSGINTTWTRVKGGKKIKDLHENLVSNYDFKNPEASIPSLLELRSNISKIKNDHWKTIKLKEIDHILNNILGIYMVASTRNEQIAIGNESDVFIEITNRSKIDFSIEFIPSNLVEIKENNIILSEYESKQLTGKLKVPSYFETTTPYYLKQKGTVGMYVVNDPEQIGKPELDSPFLVRGIIRIKDQAIPFKIPVIHKRTDPVRGEVREPLKITPEVSLSIDNPVFIFTQSQKQKITVNVHAYKNFRNAKLELCVPTDWKVKPEHITIDDLLKGYQKQYNFIVTAPSQASKGLASAILTVNDKSYTQEVISINYEHIPNQQWVRNNEVQLVQPGITNFANSVAYINGAGDQVGQAIAAMGSQVSFFDPSEVPANLSDYDAVVIGIRAFNVYKQEMAALKDILDTYVASGGTLIMQYNTNRGIGDNELGPLDITLSRKRVTDENSVVTFLAPDHRIMNQPNSITNEDFEGWVQERGLYFPEKWNDNFTPILGMNDAGEPMTKGSLLVGKYGDGHIVYTGLSLFRELPAGVSGAYKLLANMLSLSIEKEPIKQQDEERKF
ncbi:PIG-L family deacetylase [Nonlabens tegetincola]|uniref:PIG-L family deacetylase n=1 Tax=Nonlabens tegetincola TaxID=323273 RepID=UPI000CF5425C|nr:PIG-L family deacetylase [Nonlabens tegetincola]PQJ17144.1 LmbE family protein [Nonlabens tegetincola]